MIAYGHAKRRARSWGLGVRDIIQCTVIGAYTAHPLSVIEFVLHEASHLVVMGIQLKSYHARRRAMYERDATTVVSRLVTAHYGGDRRLSDLGEVKTAVLAFRVGERLALWDDPAAILESCRSNLLGEQRYQRDWCVGQMPTSEPTEQQVDQLLSWFQGNGSKETFKESDERFK
jgi:hypothetical protein